MESSKASHSDKKYQDGEPTVIVANPFNSNDGCRSMLWIPFRYSFWFVYWNEIFRYRIGTGLFQHTVSILISVCLLEWNISVSDWYRVVSAYCFRVTFFILFCLFIILYTYISLYIIGQNPYNLMSLKTISPYFSWYINFKSKNLPNNYNN